MQRRMSIHVLDVDQGVRQILGRVGREDHLGDFVVAFVATQVEDARTGLKNEIAIPWVDPSHLEN